MWLKRLLVNEAVEDRTNVVHLRQVCKHADHVHQFGVVRIVEPRGHRDGVLWVKDVGGGRVVDDDAVVDRPPQLRQVLWTEPEKKKKPRME